MPIKKIVDKMQDSKNRAKAIAAKPSYSKPSASNQQAAPPKAPTGTRGIGTIPPDIAKMIGNKVSSATTASKSLMANKRLEELKARQARQARQAAPTPKIGAIPRPAGTVSPNAAKMVGKTFNGMGMKKGGKAKKK